MTKTLEEWAEQYPMLVNNLRVNLDVYCGNMAQEEKEGLMRMNLIIIRQWEERGKE